MRPKCKEPVATGKILLIPRCTTVFCPRAAPGQGWARLQPSQLQGLEMFLLILSPPSPIPWDTPRSRAVPNLPLSHPQGEDGEGEGASPLGGGHPGRAVSGGGGRGHAEGAAALPAPHVRGRGCAGGGDGNNSALGGHRGLLEACPHPSHQSSPAWVWCTALGCPHPIVSPCGSIPPWCSPSMDNPWGWGLPSPPSPPAQKQLCWAGEELVGRKSLPPLCFAWGD